MGFLEAFFGNHKPSGEVAKNRIHFAIIQDRTQITPDMMDNLKQDIIAVIRQYAEIDETKINLTLESDNNMTALVANIPVMDVRRRPPSTRGQASDVTGRAV